MGQIEDLESNITELEDLAIELNKKMEPFDITKYFLTKRQIAKKLMASTAPVLTDPTTGQPIPTDEKAIHTIVYGKYLLDADGKLVDNEVKFPECVDEERCINIKHPIFDKIKNMGKEVKKSIKVLGVKKDKLKEAITAAGKQITTATAAVGASAATLPPGSGVPSAIAVGQAIVSAINNLATSVMDILPILGPLIAIPLMVAAAVLDMILSIVNAILMALIIILGLIVSIKKLVMPLILLVG